MIVYDCTIGYCSSLWQRMYTEGDLPPRYPVPALILDDPLVIHEYAGQVIVTYYPLNDPDGFVRHVCSISDRGVLEFGSFDP